MNLATSSWSWRTQQRYQKKSGCFGETWVSQDFPSTFSAVEPRGGLASYFNALTVASLHFLWSCYSRRWAVLLFLPPHTYTIPLPTAPPFLHPQSSSHFYVLTYQTLFCPILFFSIRGQYLGLLYFAWAKWFQKPCFSIHYYSVSKTLSCMGIIWGSLLRCRVWHPTGQGGAQDCISNVSWRKRHNLKVVS